MKKCKYEDITIEQAERITGTSYITELICDADSKTININEDEYLKVEEAIKETINNVKNIRTCYKQFIRYFRYISRSSTNIFNCISRNSWKFC